VNVTSQSSPQAPPEEKQLISGEMLSHLSRVADILFALAMAQCFLFFQAPETTRVLTDQEISDFLLAQLQPLSAYAVAFIVVGFYWIEHIKRFWYYRRANELHFWLHLLHLMGTFLIPYSNTLNMYFPENLIVKACFSIHTTLIGLLAVVSWLYATHNNRLVDADLDRNTIRLISYNALVEPVFSLLTIGVLFIDQSWWDYVWFLLPVPYILIEKRFNPLSKISSSGILAVKGHQE